MHSLNITQFHLMSGGLYVDNWRNLAAWEYERNNKNAKINWQFTSDDARIKLKRRYPTFDE